MNFAKRFISKNRKLLLFSTASVLTVGSAITFSNFQFNNQSTLNDFSFNFKQYWSTGSIHAEEVKRPQSAVVTGLHPQCAILTVRFKDPKKYKDQILQAVRSVPSILEEFNGKDKKSTEDEDDLELPPVLASIGFSTTYWKELNKEDKNKFPLPDGYTSDYVTRKGEYGEMPLQPNHLILHVKADTQSLCWETIKLFLDKIPEDAIELVEENYGFKFQDSRDLSKFIDGINNPSGKEDREEAALNKSGGSFLLHQRWKHKRNLDKLYSLREQEEFVGRERQSGMEKEKLPLTSHVARMRKVTGDIIPIVRQSFPYGKVTGEHGLLFLSYSSNTDKYDELLNAMVGKDKTGHNDAIMK
ncbi:hypothetical protein ABK040_006422 [Willaertia magna]